MVVFAADYPLVLSSLLVNIGLAVVSLLIDLVGDGITSGLGTGGELRVVVLGHVLVGFFRGSGGGALDGLGDVVGSVPGDDR